VGVCFDDSSIIIVIQLARLRRAKDLEGLGLAIAWGKQDRPTHADHAPSLDPQESQRVKNAFAA